MKRYLIAIDQDGVAFLREILFVTRNLEKGKVQYDTKPIQPSRVRWPVQWLFQQAQRMKAIK